MKIIVMKFGGGILNSAEAFNRMVEIIKMFSDHHIIVVVSAIGKTTDKLEKLLDMVPDSVEWKKLRQEIYTDHMQILQGLGLHQNMVAGAIANIFDEAAKHHKDLLAENNRDYVYDQVVSAGERASAAIVMALLKFLYLKATYVPAQSWMGTDAKFKQATPTIDSLDQVPSIFKKALPPSAEEGRIAVTEGFIGACVESPYVGSTVTLGREGSDYSAVLLGALMRVEHIHLYKDVDGIYHEDPKLNPNALKMHTASTYQIKGLIEKGSQVVSSRILGVVVEFKLINVEVVNFNNPSKRSLITP